jgi:hypothetical protein
MSVGGIVIDVVKVRADRVWVNTLEPNDFKRPLSPDKIARNAVAVYCDPKGEDIQPGDALWWQGGSCYYTPRVRPDGGSDVALPKIGYSGVSHPDKVGEAGR